MSSSLILCNDNEPFLHQIVTCDKKWILYELSAWTEKKLQSTYRSQTCTKNSHDHFLAVCCQSDPLQLSQFQWNHYMWEVCSVNWWDAPKTAMPTDSTGQQKGPDSSPWQHPTAHSAASMLQELNELGYEVLPHLPCSPDLSPTATTSSSILITLCRQNASTTTNRQKMLSKSSLNSEAQIFILQE